MIADIVDKLKLETVFLEDLALGRDAPIGIVIEPGEKAVGIGVGEDLGDADAVAAAEQGHIDACAADDNGIVAAEGGGFAEGVNDHRAGDVKLAVREDDVAAVLQYRRISNSECRVIDYRESDCTR